MKSGASPALNFNLKVGIDAGSNGFVDPFGRATDSDNPVVGVRPS